MFSDRHRFIKILGILALLLLLGWYSNRENRFLTFAECREDPERFAGATLDTFPEARVLAVSESSVRISSPDGPLELRIPEGFDGVFPEGAELGDLNPGDSLEAVAVFRLPGYLELKMIRGAPLRRYKILISIVAVGGLGFFLIRSIRWKGGFLEFRPDASGISDRSNNFELKSL